MVAALNSHKFIEGDRIVNEGDPGDLFYLIKEGTVSCTQNGTEIRRLGRGEFFGEMALLYDSPRTATVTAVSEVKCVSLGREELKHLLGNELQQIIYRNGQRVSIEQNETLKSLNHEQTEAIISAMQVYKYNFGDIVIPKMMQHGKCLWIVLRGSLRY